MLKKGASQKVSKFLNSHPFKVKPVYNWKHFALLRISICTRIRKYGDHKLHYGEITSLQPVLVCDYIENSTSVF